MNGGAAPTRKREITMEFWLGNFWVKCYLELRKRDGRLTVIWISKKLDKLKVRSE
jgi:hypothetical protein